MIQVRGEYFIMTYNTNDKPFVISKIAAEEMPDEAEVKKLAGETYRSNMKTLYAEDYMKKLVADQTVEKIEDVWETLENFH